ncbi:hypothetical protein, partial [Pseudomonas sp. RSP]|uniref:hypothetical protein n=1 Tax=Pseudomonas sp. RSP TaxID=3462641 RepID=UPI0040540A57
MDTANPLWEMSSFSEASKAAALLAGMLADPLKCAPKVGHLSNSWGFFMSKYTTQFKLSAITAFLERG